MARSTKVLFLAMDAGDTFLIRKWAANGTLKTFRMLLEKGLVGATKSVDGFFEGATWPSFYTGVTPGHHGFHRLIQLNPGTYDFYRCNTGDFITQEPFWNHLSRAGRRVAILDVPLSSISKEINGMQIVEWGCHDPCYGFSTWPRKLKQDILLRFGHYTQQGECDSFDRTPEGYALFKDRLLQGVRCKTRLTRHYLEQENWDFFAQTFTESHCVGHQCWHLHDPGHPSHDPEALALTDDPVLAVYQAIDSAIGEILRQIGDDTVVIFLASHRMAHNYGAQFLLPDILRKLQACHPLAAGTTSARSQGVMGRVEASLAWCWHHLPNTLKEKLGPTHDGLCCYLDTHGDIVPSSLSGIDPKKSRCFPLDNGLSVGGIRVNLAGREPDGIIEPGTGMESFCQELAADLMDIVDADTGKPMITSVKRTTDLYQGERMDHLPDLLVLWNDEKPIGNCHIRNAAGSKVRLFSRKTGIVEGINRYCRTGDHRAEGLFIAFGGGVKAGSVNRTVSLIDFAPTFGSLLGVELPLAEGEPIVEILQALSPPYR